MVFYEPGKTSHDLPRDPFKACVVPRPIGWISTLSASGQPNLAPYSQFNNLTYDPPLVMFSANQRHSGERKDSVINAETGGSFCWNLATWELREAVNASAEGVDFGVDEFARAGLEKEWTSEQGPLGKRLPMVRDSPVRFECVVHSTLRIPGNPVNPASTVDIVIGRVVGVHIAEWALTEGKVDLSKTKPIARCGYYEYAVIDKTFEMIIPGDDRALLAGLEGNPAGALEGLKHWKEGQDAKQKIEQDDAANGTV